MNNQVEGASPTRVNPLANRQEQIFPVLTSAQLELVARYGKKKKLPSDVVLFTQGERHISMFFVLSGHIELSRTNALKSHVISVIGTGKFSGEVGTLDGRSAIATGKTVGDCELIEVDEENLRNLIVSEAELSETIMRAFILRRMGFINDAAGSVILLGGRVCARTLELREFLMRNNHPTAYFDVEEHAETAELMERYSITVDDLPALITIDDKVLKRPTMRQVADAIGMSPDELNGKEFDLVVVGAGPGGLAAAVYASSEGLRVAVLDSKAPGGQAGSSSRIENYFGFPTGISGRALAGRGLSQARKFGAEVAVPVGVLHLDCRNPQNGYRIELDSGAHVIARTVIVSTGARYKRPALAGLDNFEGRGIYYNASFMEATFCARQEVVIVGGGNSAGQAAVFLAEHAKKVHIFVRSAGLAASMSRYLIQRIEAASNIEVHTYTEIRALEGQQNLERILVKKRDQDEHPMEIKHVFLFLGAEPSTAWLRDCVSLDRHNFVLTGNDVPADMWKLKRRPYYLETSRPGVFAVGDVRSGSVKRVAAAVGEGAAAVQALHAVLSSMAEQ